MRTVVFIMLTFCTTAAIGQTDSLKALADIKAFQTKLNAEYKSRKESPLEPKDIKNFKGHDFFPVNLAYRVNAKLTITEGTPFLQMKTTTTRLSADRIYGYIEFTLAGMPFKLPIYQIQDLMKKPEYIDYLFFPFSDLTNGVQTYGGGRFIDLRIPKGQTQEYITIDFNQAYNPFCAYNHKYSCPLVPKDNQMEIEIPVGVRYK